MFGSISKKIVAEHLQNKAMSPIQLKRQECIIYSRVVGWLTPTKNYNKGKAAEYKDRKFFKINESCDSSD